MSQGAEMPMVIGTHSPAEMALNMQSPKVLTQGLEVSPLALSRTILAKNTRTEEQRKKKRERGQHLLLELNKSPTQVIPVGLSMTMEKRRLVSDLVERTRFLALSRKELLVIHRNLHLALLLLVQERRSYFPLVKVGLDFRYKSRVVEETCRHLQLSRLVSQERCCSAQEEHHIGNQHQLVSSHYSQFERSGLDLLGIPQCLVPRNTSRVCCFLQQRYYCN